MKFGDPASIQKVKAARAKAEQEATQLYTVNFKYSYTIEADETATLTVAAADEDDALEKVYQHLDEEEGYEDFDILWHKILEVKPIQRVDNKTLPLFEEAHDQQKEVRS